MPSARGLMSNRSSARQEAGRNRKRIARSARFRELPPGRLVRRCCVEGTTRRSRLRHRGRIGRVQHDLGMVKNCVRAVLDSCSLLDIDERRFQSSLLPLSRVSPSEVFMLRKFSTSVFSRIPPALLGTLLFFLAAVPLSASPPTNIRSCASPRSAKLRLH